jgi:hypothetical protein
MSYKTGGPAFPATNHHGHKLEGMTLRDYFAAKTMQYWLCHPINLEDADRCARNAYSMADAMLKARDQ